MSHPVPDVDHRQAADERAMNQPGASPAGDLPADANVSGVAAARERLAELDDAPLEQHVDVYEDVHHRLQEGLADLDEK